MDRLQELCSEVYVADDGAADKLWQEVGATLQKLEIDQAEVERLLQDRSPKALLAKFQEIDSRS